MKIKIRKAKRGDLKRIVEIYRLEYAKKPYNERWTEEMAVKKIRGYSKDNYIYVAEADDCVVGFVVFGSFLWFNGLNGFANDIAILSGYQRKGIGKMLVKKMEEEFKRKKIKTIWAMAHKDSPALNFHKKSGFKETGYLHIKKELT